MATKPAGGGGVLAEFASRPPGFKVAVFVGIAVALGALYYTLAYKGLDADLKAANDEKNALISQGQKLKKDEEEYKALKTQQEKLKETIALNADALPTAAELPAFFDLLNRKFAEAGVEVKSWNQEKELAVEQGEGADVETYYKVPVSIEVQATFFELKRFFYLLYKMSQREGDAKAAAPPAPAPAPQDGAATPPAPAIVPPAEERDRIVTIEELTIEDPRVVNSELVLTARFRASTFRQDTPAGQADAADKPGAAGSKTKAPAKNLPQKMKGKAEDAVDKSEQRARTGAEADGEKLAPDSSAPGTGAERVKGGI
jgi:Tfp pilus assembly protein PilO